MRTTHHMCLDVRGALKNWKPRDFRNMFTDRETGRTLSIAEARAYLLDELAQGHLLLPMAECDGFSFTDGCPGHPEEVA